MGVETNDNLVLQSILVVLFFISKLAARVLDVLAGVRLDFFMLRTSGTQNIVKKRYMKCTFCLSVVGALYPSDRSCQL